MQEEIFEKYPIPKAYFKLALPVVFSMVISLVYNMVDTYFIAGTGNTDLVAGVALGSPIFTLMIALGDIFGLGGSSFISRLFGEKRYEDAKRISVFSFYGAIVSGVAVAAVLMIFRSLILGLLGASEATWEYASQYYTCIALGAPFIIVALTPSNQLNRRICDGFDGWFCTWRSCKHYSGSDHDLCTGLGCGRRSYSDRDRKCLYRYFLCMVSY